MILEHESVVEEIYSSPKVLDDGVPQNGNKNLSQSERKNVSLDIVEELNLHEFIRTWPGPTLNPSARGWDMAEQRPASFGTKVHLLLV